VSRGQLTVAASGYDLDVCRFAGDCREPGGDGGGGTTGGRGLCYPDELHGQWVIGQLPRLYVDIHAEVGKDAGRNGLGAPIGSGGGMKVDPPTPINLGMDAAAREIAWTLQVWAAPVWDLLPRTEAARLHEDASRWPVARAARLLVAHYPVLRSLGPTSHYPYVRDGTEPAVREDDGPGAIVALVDLYRRSRSILGETRRFELRHLPCPRPAGDDDPDRAGGCGLEGTLLHEVGTDRVGCCRCGWECTTAQYDLYALTFIPPPARRRLERET
jgi:hypothetical protein